MKTRYTVIGCFTVNTLPSHRAPLPGAPIANDGAGSSTGVGLRNASERLKLLFGGQAALTLTAEPAGFVTAAVTIPLEPRP